MPPFPVPPPRRRRTGFAGGGQPLPLPIVAAIAATNPTGAAVTLNGSVNPQGLAGSCWFQWGTTPQTATTTAAQTVEPVTQPTLFQARLTGLSATATYWFALAASTPAGTVISPPVQFTAAQPAAVTTATSPLPVTTAPLVSIPHMVFPVRVTATGVAVAQQDTLPEVASCVAAIVACPAGACPEIPSLGVPDLAFTTAPVPAAPLVNAVRDQEPRADERTIVTVLDQTGGDWQVALNVTLAQANTSASQTGA